MGQRPHGNYNPDQNNFIEDFGPDYFSDNVHCENGPVPPRGNLEACDILARGSNGENFDHGDFSGAGGWSMNSGPSMGPMGPNGPMMFDGPMGPTGPIGPNGPMRHPMSFNGTMGPSMAPNCQMGPGGPMIFNGPMGPGGPMMFNGPMVPPISPMGPPNGFGSFNNRAFERNGQIEPNGPMGPHNGPMGGSGWTFGAGPSGNYGGNNGWNNCGPGPMKNRKNKNKCKQNKPYAGLPLPPQND